MSDEIDESYTPPVECACGHLKASHRAHGCAAVVPADPEAGRAEPERCPCLVFKS